MLIFFFRGGQLSRQNVELTGFIIWLVFVADITGGLISQLQGIINYLITDSEVVTGKSQTEVLPC